MGSNVDTFGNTIGARWPVSSPTFLFSFTTVFLIASLDKMTVKTGVFMLTSNLGFFTVFSST
jgi:hypothetical protein